MSDTNQFMELMQKREDLLPELEPYLSKGPLGTMLKHPLVFSIFYSPEMNAMLNESYRKKKEYLEECKIKRQWSTYIFLHERPHRIEAFVKIVDELGDKEYWELLGGIWADSENLWQHGRILPYLINLPRPGREFMMDEEERQFLSSLPEEFIIYRGHQKKNRLGYSWTLSFEKAAWFSTRFGKVRHVVSAIVSKEDVIAVLLGRSEFEIVVNPANLRQVKSIKKIVRPPFFELVWNEARCSGLLLTGLHGPLHWEKVERNAIALANLDNRIDKKVVRLFAILHDCHRKNEDDDPDHGRRAAEFTKKLFSEGKLQINLSQLNKLVYAMEEHNEGKTSDDPTIGACWDADRLDLPRVGIAPNVKYLSTEAAKKLMWKV